MSNAFNMELRAQQEWSWLLAIWLFLGGTRQRPLPALSGLRACRRSMALWRWRSILVGGVDLLLELGSPLRAWRAVFRAGTSWLSRGACCVVAVHRLGVRFRSSRGSRSCHGSAPLDEQPRGPRCWAGLPGSARVMIIALSGLLLPLDLARDPVLEHAAAAAVFRRLRPLGRRGIGVAADALRAVRRRRSRPWRSR